MSFEEQLALGHEGEKLVDRFLRGRGCGVIQSYGFLGAGDDKAPRLRYAIGGFVLPDLDVIKPESRFWVEVKTLWHAPVNRKRGIRVHGFRRRLYDDYLEVEAKSKAPVYVCVLEMETGDLLWAKLLGLTPLPCQCKQCSNRCLVYFDRAQFVLAGNLASDPEFISLRSRYTQAREDAA